MLISRFTVWTLVGTAALVTSVAWGQEYPAKTIRIHTSAAGGGTDFAARIIAQGISTAFEQPVVVDNRPLINSIEIVSKAPPDGYSLLVTGATVWILPLLQNVPYDTVRDFSPITFTGSSPFVLAVHPSLPVKSVTDLIALAKSRPGALNYGSPTTGSPNHLAAELFKSMAGVDIVRVNYKGTGPSTAALLGGEVQALFTTPPTAAPHMKSGRIRTLAVSTLRQSELLPGLPSVSDSGLPGFEVVSIDAVVAPARTPTTIINRLRQEIVRDINRPEVRKRFFDAGIEIVGNSPEEADKFIRAEILKLGKVIKSAGIKLE